MGVYKRGRIWWIRYMGPTGMQFESTGQGDRRIAERIERQRKAEVANGTWSPPQQRVDRRLTLGQYGDQWIARLRDREVRTARDYEQRWRDHVRPALGHWPMEALRPRHVREWVERLRSSQLSPRSVHHCYDVLRSICRDAVADEVIVASPAVLPKGVLPPKRDKDPRWRPTAVYTREEVELLISHPSVPWDRRVLYAMLFGTGMRFGEAAGRRWRDYDAEAQPLGKLEVWSQYNDQPLKTDRPRSVPVHRMLAAVLAEWRLEGWGQYQGRSPGRDDLITPSRRGAVRSVRHAHRRLREDCERLRLRPRRLHDTRRTMISLARADGARDDVLREITHGPRGDIIDVYTTLPWHTLCEAVECLRIQRRQWAPVTVLPVYSELDNQGASGANCP